jgi:simple sugar transport system permease protein
MSDSALERAWRWWNDLSSRPFMMAIYSLVLGLLVGAVLIIVTTPEVLTAWRGTFDSIDGIGHALNVSLTNIGDAYRAIFVGSIFDPAQLWHSVTTGHAWGSSLAPISNTINDAVPLVIVSIACGIGFEAGLFNIGANGQAIVGAIAGTAVGSMIHLPMFLLLPFALVTAIVAGAATGMIPGLLKAYAGAHEVIVTLMFNYVANFLLIYVVLSTPLEQPGNSSGISRTLEHGAQLVPLIGNTNGTYISVAIFISLAVVVAAWWFLDWSSLGFDFKVTGANIRAARASGISSRTITISAFLISGGLAGLAGFVYVASQLPYSISSNTLQGNAGIGFMAITISLLGRNRPLGILFASLLFGALFTGGTYMTSTTNISGWLATIIQYVIVLFIATPGLVQTFFRINGTKLQGVQISSAGWGA